MPTTIRRRLLLLMMTVLLPGIAATLFMVVRTYQGERAALQRGLRDSALAMAQVIDREFARRQDIARALASSRLLSRTGSASLELQYLHAWCSGITREMGGRIELHSATHELMDTEQPADAPARPHAGREFTLLAQPAVVPMTAADGGGWQPAKVVQPVRTADDSLLNIVVTVPPEVLQRAIDHQGLPASWVGTVVDSSMRVVARQPGGAGYIGRPATPDMHALMERVPEGPFTSVTLDGVRVNGHYSRTPQGWYYMTAAPRAELGGWLPSAVVEVLVGSLVLLGLAGAAAVWVARSIAEAAESMNAAAATLQQGAVPPPAPATGIVEFDAVGGTLYGAARSLADARGELERQVADAVARTRAAEQRASQGQRIAALGRLTGGVAHDFNNLLGIIANSAHLVARHVAANPALQMPVAMTQRAVETGTHLAQQLLRFGGQQPVNPGPVDLATFLTELHEMMQMVLRKSIALTLDVQPGTLPANIDRSELELALINVALNARDAMPGGGGLHIEARNATPAEAEGLAPGTYVLLAVTDTGVGMDEQQLAQVFEPFYTTKPVGRGTGLGLSQVHGFCAQAGGAARISSRPGEGCTVSLVLPAGTTQAPPADEQDVADDRADALAGLRLLLVEDSDDLVEVTSALLQSYGCEVRRARDVDDALAQIAADASLQLVLSDVVMPGGRDGVALARELARTRPDLPVVLISGYSHSLARLTGFAVLRKPVTAGQLVRTLKAALARAAQPAGARSA